MQEFSPELPTSFSFEPGYPANPFAALTGEAIYPNFEKRGRGRPRKHNLPVTIGKQEHKMGDREVECAELSLTQRKSMIEFFKIQIKLNPLREALEFTAEKYKITYAKAHHDLSNYF